jgi:hypothetical protein
MTDCGNRAIDAWWAWADAQQDEPTPEEPGPMTDLKGRKMILAIDFDGVIHDYKKGWQGGELYGHATCGWFEWYLHVSKRFDIVIHTSRAVDDLGCLEVVDWLNREYAAWREHGSKGYPDNASEQLHDWLLARREELPRPLPERIIWQVQATKPPAYLSIDDRAVRFDGDWSADSVSMSALYRFRTWSDPRRS